MARITLEVEFSGDREDLDVLLDALGPEDEEEFPGVDARLSRDDAGQVTLTLAGSHAPQVRAATNAYLTWVRTVEDVLDVEPA